MCQRFVLPAVFILLGLSSAQAQQKKIEDMTVCYVTFTLQVAYFQAGVRGGKQEAERLGAEIVVLDPQGDAQRQAQQAEDCIARNVDAMVLDPIESSALSGVIEEAGQRGIPITVLDTPIDSPYVMSKIGVPQYDVSKELGQFVAGYVIGKMDGQAKVGIMLASTEVQLLRRDGFLEALKAVPGAEVVATGDGRNQLERSIAEAEDMLSANPDINVIYATGDPALQGALAAAASQGRDDIAFFGWDDIPAPFIEPLQDGRIVGFIKQGPEHGGQMGVRFALEAAAGKPVPPVYRVPVNVVTRYNLNDFL